MSSCLCQPINSVSLILYYDDSHGSVNGDEGRERKRRRNRRRLLLSPEIITITSSSFFSSLQVLMQCSPLPSFAFLLYFCHLLFSPSIPVFAFFLISFAQSVLSHLLPSPLFMPAETGLCLVLFAWSLYPLPFSLSFFLACLATTPVWMYELPRASSLSLLLPVAVITLSNSHSKQHESPHIHSTRFSRAKITKA